MRDADPATPPADPGRLPPSRGTRALNAPLQVVIVGGGTAGWMAAAAMRSALKPELYAIVVVESEEIGTVGVGEATLPQMKEFNDAIGLSEAEMMRRTNATFKLGIEFVDWGRKGASYIHPFGTYGPPGAESSFRQRWLRAAGSGRATDLESFSFAIAAARRNRFAFPAEDPRSLQSSYGYAYHFDASLYAAVLRGYAEAAGVRRIEGKVVKVALDPARGDIASLELESGESIEGDFFIDCSGFRSLLLGEALGGAFEDWSKWLPCDRALAVPSTRTGALTPYTRSTAREAGWQWRIPLQHRTGNGYVFSSSFIGEDEAAASLMRNLGAAPLGEPRLLRFQAGRRVRAWERNCVGLGLAGGFLEPLESTSIYLIQMGIFHLLPLFPGRQPDPRLADEYNRRMDAEYARIRDFLILHYHAGERDDSELWRYCRAMEVPESLSARIELFRHRGHIDQYRDGLFAPASWLSLYIGQGIEPAHHHPMADAVPLDRLVAELETVQREIADQAEALPSHDAFVREYCPAEAAA